MWRGTHVGAPVEAWQTLCNSVKNVSHSWHLSAHLVCKRPAFMVCCWIFSLMVVLRGLTRQIKLFVGLNIAKIPKLWPLIFLLFGRTRRSVCFPYYSWTGLNYWRLSTICISGNCDGPCGKIHAQSQHIVQRTYRMDVNNVCSCQFKVKPNHTVCILQLVYCICKTKIGHCKSLGEQLRSEDPQKRRRLILLRTFLFDKALWAAFLMPANLFFCTILCTPTPTRVKFTMFWLFGCFLKLQT